MKEILNNLKVIEVASVLAGPSAGMYFAELGAKVIKIENKRSKGDVTRSWRLPSEGSNSISAYYASINYGKESIFLDFKDSSDIENLHALIQDADILITNFPGDKARKYGLSPSDIQNNYPQLISLNITGFGSISERLAYDLILQAESGFMSMNGEPDSPPTKMPVALIDLLAGHQAKEAILVGLLNKVKTGKGCHIETSLYKSAISSLANQANNYLMGGEIPTRKGSKHPNIAPYGEIFITSDNKQIVFAIGSNKHFEGLCSLTNKEDILSDPRYSVNKSRVENRDSLCLEIQDGISKLKASVIEEECLNLGVPMAIIKDLSEVFQDTAKKQVLSFNKEGVSNLKAVSQNASEYTFF